MLPVTLLLQIVCHAAYKLELKAIFIQIMFAMLIAQLELIKDHLIILAKIAMQHAMDVWIPQPAAYIVLYCIIE